VINLKFKESFSQPTIRISKAFLCEQKLRVVGQKKEGQISQSNYRIL
jgi:hypothetical protein